MIGTTQVEFLFNTRFLKDKTPTLAGHSARIPRLNRVKAEVTQIHLFGVGFLSKSVCRSSLQKVKDARTGVSLETM